MATAMFDLAAMDGEARTVAGGRGRLGWREARALLLGCADAERRAWTLSVAPGGLLARCRARLLTMLGIEPLRPLASQRLETLRLYAFHARRRDPQAELLLRRLPRLGLSPSQMVEVHAIVDG